MQGTNNSEAVGMESLKMETFCRCKRRTKLQGPSNGAVHCCAVYCYQWKFAYIREVTLPGTMVALMKGEYNSESVGMESLKMETFCRCKRRTKLHGPSNGAVHCCAVYCYHWKFVHIREVT